MPETSTGKARSGTIGIGRAARSQGVSATRVRRRVGSVRPLRFPRRGWRRRVPSDRSAGWADTKVTAGRRKAVEVIAIDAILENRGSEPFDVVEVLQDMQKSCGYLPEEGLRQVSDSFGVPLIEVFRLASFYKAFSLKPRGRHLVTVCLGTACHVRGAPRMLDEVASQLGVGPGETTEDQAFTVETVNCLGACALGPVVVLDGQYHDHMTSAKLRGLLSMVRTMDLEAARETTPAHIPAAASV